MPSDWRFAAIKKLLEAHGWQLVRIRGSHHIFAKVGAKTVVIPVHRGHVRFVYVRQVQNLIEEGGSASV